MPVAWGIATTWLAPGWALMGPGLAPGQQHKQRCFLFITEVIISGETLIYRRNTNAASRTRQKGYTRIEVEVAWVRQWMIGGWTGIWIRIWVRTWSRTWIRIRIGIRI